MKKRIVASDESCSREEAFENNIIEELNGNDKEVVSPRKRLRSNAQSEENGEGASMSDEEIYYDEDDDLSNVIFGKFKPDPFGLRSSRRSNNEHEETDLKARPQRSARRAKKFEAHLQDYESKAPPDQSGLKRSRISEESDGYESPEELSNIHDRVSDQDEEDGEYTSSESDASFVPNNEMDVKVSDDEMNGEPELQDAEQPDESELDEDDLDLAPDHNRKPPARNPTTRSTSSQRKWDEPSSEDDNKDSASSEEKVSGLEDISLSDEQARPMNVTPSKRKREILSDDEDQDDEEPVNSKRGSKRPRVTGNDHDDSVASEGSEKGEDVANSTEEKEAMKGDSSDNESIELESQAEEDSENDDDDDFEHKNPGDWRDLMSQLRQIEALVEELQATEETKKRRGANKQYSIALEKLLYFTDHTNTMGQMFTSSVSYTSFLQRISRTWTLFLKAVGLRLEQSQTDSIVRTFVRCHKRPYLKIANSMWKNVFSKTERVYPLNHDELLDLCSPRTQVSVQKQVQYLWLAKRLRNHDMPFESLMLCCAMGEFYKHRYPKKRTVQISTWEDDLHQRFVTHMLTLAASPLRNINEMSLFNEAGWKYVSIVAGNPLDYMTLDVSEGVKRDFVSRFVLYYVLMYTKHAHFHSIKEKCEKLRRTIRTNIPFEDAFKCIRDPDYDVFVRLGDNGCNWLQNIVLERLLLFETHAVSPTTMFQILAYKGEFGSHIRRYRVQIGDMPCNNLVETDHDCAGLWDIALSSISTPRGATCKMMVNVVPSLIPLPKTPRYMFIEVVERRIRAKEKLTGSTRRGIQSIGQISTSMQIYLTAIGNAFEMIGNARSISPALTDLRLLRYHMVSIQKEHDWRLIMNHVEDTCRDQTQKGEYAELRDEEPFIDADTNWIDKILARSDVDALDSED